MISDEQLREIQKIPAAHYALYVVTENDTAVIRVADICQELLDARIKIAELESENAALRILMTTLDMR
jgi:hypothetical protein